MRDDLVLTDNGERQKISILSLERGDRMAASAASLPAGFSNRLEYKGGVPNSVTVILFDLVNTPREYYGRSRSQIAGRMLRSSAWWSGTPGPAPWAR